MKSLPYLILFCSLVGIPSTPLSHAIQPKNVILAIGDGMGYNHVLAGRIHKGQPSKPLVMETFPVHGSLDTHSIGNDYITDSAASATAMATGFKTENGRVSTFPDGKDTSTLFQDLKANGFQLGIVTNGSVNGATAGAFSSHATSREDKETISRQLIELRPDFVFGSCDDLFFPDANSPVTKASLLEAGWTVAIDRAIDKAQSVSGPTFIGYSELIRERESQEQRRNVYDENAPTLAEALEIGLERFQDSAAGFFVLLEEDWIDSWSHENDFELTANSVSDLDDAVAVALEFAKRDTQTLVIVTADHECGGLTIPKFSEGEVGAHFSTEEHTAALVPLYAFGPGAEHFSGTLDNTDIHSILERLLLGNDE